MKCASCSKGLSADELDTDGLCYDCANFDPEFPTEASQFKGAVEEFQNEALGTLAYAKSQSSKERPKN